MTNTDYSHTVDYILACPGLDVYAGDLNSGPHACGASTVSHIHSVACLILSEELQNRSNSEKNFPRGHCPVHNIIS